MDMREREMENMRSRMPTALRILDDDDNELDEY